MCAWKTLKTLKVLCVTKYLWLTQPQPWCTCFYVSQPECVFWMASMKPTVLCKCSTKPQHFNCTQERLECSLLFAQQENWHCANTHTHNMPRSLPKWPLWLMVASLIGAVQTGPSLVGSLSKQFLCQFIPQAVMSWSLALLDWLRNSVVLDWEAPESSFWFGAIWTNHDETH